VALNEHDGVEEKMPWSRSKSERRFCCLEAYPCHDVYPCPEPRSWPSSPKERSSRPAAKELVKGGGGSGGATTGWRELWGQLAAAVGGNDD
jgi:hypothetical protein